MRKAHVLHVGNGLMVFGLVLCVSSIAVAMLSQAPGTVFSDSWATAAILGIFAGAFFWLFGAQLSGREKVCEKYYLLTLHKRPLRRHRPS